MLSRITLLLLSFIWTTILTGQSVFFNEIDYLSNNNCVELATAPDQDLTDWSVTTYDDNGLVQNTIPLTGVPPSSTTPTGYNIIEVDIVFLQPNTGGLILQDDNNNIVQFISYNGALTAVDGPAAGSTAEDIGTLTTVGNTLQLQGIGTSYPDFIWQVLDAGTCGVVNPDQEFVPIGTPLPVELIYFEASYQENQNVIHLEWATASEINHDHFVLERSVNGLNFESIDVFYNNQIQSTELKQYNYQDRSIFAAQYYYRLKQVDRNGEISLSAIINVEIPDFIVNQPIVFPNPISNQLNIRLVNSSDPVILKLYNSKGLFIKEIIAASNENFVSLNITDLPAGTYYLYIRQGDKDYYYPLIKP